jgi:metal-responsive CopG/Arc/MetJ family transcriptional regulator
LYNSRKGAEETIMAQSITSPIQTIEVTGLPESLLRRLDARARERGSDRSGQIRELLEKGLAQEDAQLTGQSFDRSLAAIRAGFAESGMEEEETLELLTDSLHKVRAERRDRVGQDG